MDLKNENNELQLENKRLSTASTSDSPQIERLLATVKQLEQVSQDCELTSKYLRTSATQGMTEQGTSFKQALNRYLLYTRDESCHLSSDAVRYSKARSNSSFLKALLYPVLFQDLWAYFGLYMHDCLLSVAIGSVRGWPGRGS